MGEIDDAIERADREAFTRHPPKTLQVRINFLMKQLKTTKSIAHEIGVSQRSVERYCKGERKHPPQAVEDRIDAAVRARWQPQVRKRRQKQASTTQAGSRWRQGPGSATPHLSAPPATDASAASPSTSPPRPTRSASSTPARLGPATSRCARSSPKASKDVYFHDNGNRAMTLSHVTLNDIDYLDLDY